MKERNRERKKERKKERKEIRKRARKARWTIRRKKEKKAKLVKINGAFQSLFHQI